MLLQDRARQHWARTGGLGVGGSCVPDWEKGWETLPLAGLLSAVDPVHYEGYFPVSVSWAGSSNPGRKYILQGPALPLILLWPQFQGLGLPGSRVSSEGRLLSIYRWRGVQKKNIIWLLCSLLVIVSLVLSPNHAVSASWTPAPLQVPMWAPRPPYLPLLSPSTTESDGQPVDVSQHKASKILSPMKPLDDPPSLTAPDVALWAFLGTIFSLGPKSPYIWEVPK